MKDVAIPQTLIQVDRDILKHCRTYSFGETIISWSEGPNEHLYEAVFGRVAFIWRAVVSTFICTCTEMYQPDLFYMDLCFGFFFFS